MQTRIESSCAPFAPLRNTAPNRLPSDVIEVVVKVGSFTSEMIQSLRLVSREWRIGVDQSVTNVTIYDAFSLNKLRNLIVLKSLTYKLSCKKKSSDYLCNKINRLRLLDRCLVHFLEIEHSINFSGDANISEMINDLFTFFSCRTIYAIVRQLGAIESVVDWIYKNKIRGFGPSFSMLDKLPRLSELNLKGLTNITEHGVITIGQLTNLRTLKIFDCSNITSKELQLIVNMRSLKNLHLSLPVADFSIMDEAAGLSEAFDASSIMQMRFESRLLRQIKIFADKRSALLRGLKITTDVGSSSVAEIAKLPNLNKLSIKNKLLLNAHPNLQLLFQITSLNLGKNSVGFCGMSLKNLPNLKKL